MVKSCSCSKKMPKRNAPHKPTQTTEHTMARTHARARMGVRSSERSPPTDADVARTTEAMRRRAPKVKEVADKILAAIKELADIEKQLKDECPGAKYTHGILPQQVAYFTMIQRKAEELIAEEAD
jgi:hypothetical protein